jgi:hypothetical protein
MGIITMTTKEIVSLFQGKRRGSGWMAHCPAHDDDNPSLSIAEGHNGCILINCLAGCALDEILAALGLTKRDLFPDSMRLPAAAASAQTKPASVKKIAAKFDWQAGVAAMTDEHIEQIARERGYSISFVRELREKGLIGIYKGLVAFPVENDGKIVGAHVRMKNKKDWFYTPSGIKAAPFVFGDLLEWEHIHAFESTWDGLDYMDKSGEREGIIITRGSRNGAFVGDLIREGAIAYLWQQNDVPDLKTGKAAGEEWTKTVCAHPKNFIVKRVNIQAHDLNDWTRNGATVDDLIAAIKNAQTLPDAKTTQPSPEKPKKEKVKKESAASQLVAFVVDQGGGQDASGGRQVGPFSLFHDPHDRAFARYQFKDHVEIWPVESSKFKKILARLYYNSTGKIINRNSLADAVTTLAGLACHDNPEEPTFLRVAPYGDDIVIDLCDQRWRVVLVTAKEWQILETSPIAFVRTGSMRALPEPRAGGGSIEPLWQLLNVTKAQRPLVAGALLNGFHPFGPYFVANYVGEHGSAKSSAARIHRQLIDPNQNPLRSPPKEENDLFAQAINNRCVALDNLSYLPLWLSDALCRTATGGGLSKRTLYTDMDETSQEVKRPVIINGIEDVATRPDLADRVLQIELEEIPNKRRITEKVLLREFETARPVIFTAILDAVSMALRTLPQLKMPPLPRMADAAEWATAGETAFGFERWTFLKAYQRNLDESAEVAVDANPVGAAIRILLEKQDQWEGEPRELLEALVELVSDKVQKQDDWPKNPQKLGHVLRRIAPALRRAGIGYERPARGKHRTIRLFKAPEKPAKTDDNTDADSSHFHVV